MILTKVSAGHFTGAKNKIAHLALQPRDPSVTAKILSVVYGTTKIDHTNTTFDVKVAAGEQALAIVYACTDTVFVDLVETDSNDTQKLKSDKFDPEDPFLSIWIQEA